MIKFLQSSDSRLRTDAVWVKVKLTFPCPGAFGQPVQLKNAGMVFPMQNNLWSQPHFVRCHIGFQFFQLESNHEINEITVDKQTITFHYQQYIVPLRNCTMDLILRIRCYFSCNLFSCKSCMERMNLWEYQHYGCLIIRMTMLC